jgi:hypothetical protein
MAAAAEPPCAAEQEREAFLSAYGDMLRDLKAPDKVAINTLSMLAGDNKQHMPGIVNAIMQHIIKVWGTAPAAGGGVLAACASLCVVAGAHRAAAAVRPHSPLSTASPPAAH